MKNVLLLIALMFVGSVSYAGECVSGNCKVLRSRAVTVTQEIVQVPVAVTRRTVEASRNVGSRTVNDNNGWSNISRVLQKISNPKDIRCYAGSSPRKYRTHVKTRISLYLPRRKSSF